MIPLIVIALLFLFVYLAVLRPQKRRRVEEAQRLQSLAVGDEVITAGGIYGSVTGFVDEDLLVEIAPSLQVRVARRAIAAIVPPDEADDEEPSELEEGAAHGEIRAAEAGEIRPAEPESYSEGPR